MTIRFSISIVSHGDSDAVVSMLERSVFLHNNNSIEILIRENLTKSCDQLDALQGRFGNLSVFYNETIFGFGKNHNLNFNCCDPDSRYFIVCNPDLVEIPFFEDAVPEYDSYCLSSATILNADESHADFLRGEISLGVLLARFLGFDAGRTAAKDVVWVPSVFKLFSRELFSDLGGYDEAIFMYYEDYDICMRARAFCDLVVLPNLVVVHEGRRASRRDLSLFLKHLRSVAYVLRKHR